ncbi:MAG: hypothetical protein KDK64_02890 [Chlamydiia bacterium]|nr:hypothetical protein [Chlamydiia bacterium]
MQEEIVKYFEKEEATFLSKVPKLSWEKAQKTFPRLPKGWFELSRLDSGVRQEFLRDYWINALTYSPQLYAFVDRFFATVEETEIVVSKGGVFLVYGLKKGRTFFLGGPPLTDQEVGAMVNQVDFPVPQDFKQFFRIHNGFFKKGDTGIFSSGVLVEEGQRFRDLNQGLKMGNQTLTTGSLLPFYRSFGLDVYQCFYQDWYPDGGVGNVLCSLSEGRISDYRIKDRGRDDLAFPTFIEWLMFYMEDF